MLEPMSYPEDFPRPLKYDVLRKQAESVGMLSQCRPVLQMTAFRQRTNAAGVTLRPSTRTGQDCMGDNDGSRNSTLVTYLSDAHNWGAKM